MSAACYLCHTGKVVWLDNELYGTLTIEDMHCGWIITGCYQCLITSLKFHTLLATSYTRSPYTPTRINCNGMT